MPLYVELLTIIVSFLLCPGTKCHEPNRRQKKPANKAGFFRVRRPDFHIDPKSLDLTPSVTVVGFSPSVAVGWYSLFSQAVNNFLVHILMSLKEDEFIKNTSAPL